MGFEFEFRVIGYCGFLGLICIVDGGRVVEEVVVVLEVGIFWVLIVFFFWEL